MGINYYATTKCLAAQALNTCTSGAVKFAAMTVKCGVSATFPKP